MGNEKFDEKEMEKREEKAPEEKSTEEKWRRDPISAIEWAAILVWAGLVLLANNLGFLNIVGPPGLPSDGQPGGFLAAAGVWGLISLGAGGILLLGVLARLLLPEYRRPVGGSLLLGFILIGIGLGNVFGWDITWPLILIGIGLIVLLRGFIRKV